MSLFKHTFSIPTNELNKIKLQRVIGNLGWKYSVDANSPIKSIITVDTNHDAITVGQYLQDHQCVSNNVCFVSSIII